MEQLLGEIKECRYYSILADKPTYCSFKEQLALIFRFADKESNIREKFVFFVECTYGLSGHSLYRSIKKFLNLAGIYIFIVQHKDMMRPEQLQVKTKDYQHMYSD